jgi:hypothetical protein
VRGVVDLAIDGSRVLKSEIFRDGFCGSGGAMPLGPYGLKSTSLHVIKSETINLG